jgi:hypothetical protein
MADIPDCGMSIIAIGALVQVGRAILCAQAQRAPAAAATTAGKRTQTYDCPQ